MIFAFRAVLDDLRYCLLNAHPMVLFRNRSSGLIDAAMIGNVDLSGNVVLQLSIRDNLFIFQH